MEEKIIYLDHAATTFAEEAVIVSMTECMRNSAFNASAAYSAAGHARRIHRLCRRQIASMLSCPQEDLFFTSGGTEANNWVVRSFAGSHMVVSGIEHHSILNAARSFASSLTIAAADETGYISPEAIAQCIRPDTRLICLQAANNETGVIQSIREVCALARSHGIHLHVDAVQAFGHIPLSADCCDSMSLSAHKIYGPRGVGALYIRSGASIQPLLLGGSQESGMRAGTENTPAICGLETAARLAQEDLTERMQREQALLDVFVNQIISSFPGARRLGETRNRLPGVCALLLPGYPSESVIASLDLKGILISGGAACASSDGKPSHVYTAMGLSEEDAKCVIRVSIGRHTTPDELNAAADALIRLIPQQAH